MRPQFRNITRCIHSINTRSSIGCPNIPNTYLKLKNLSGGTSFIAAKETPNISAIKLVFSSIPTDKLPSKSVSINRKSSDSYKEVKELFDSVPVLDSILINKEFATVTLGDTDNHNIDKVMDILKKLIETGIDLRFDTNYDNNIKASEDENYRKIADAMNIYVKPFVHGHGGDIELIDFKDGVVFVKLSGSCDGCSLSEDTLRDGVLNVLRTQVGDFIKDIEKYQSEFDKVSMERFNYISWHP